MQATAITHVMPFEATDLQANREGRMSAAQQASLRPTVDAHQTLLVTQSMVITGFGVAFMMLVVSLSTGTAIRIGGNAFTLLTMLVLVSAVMILPFATRQAVNSYALVQQYRDGEVDTISGVLEIRPLTDDGEQLAVLVGGVPSFIIAQETFDSIAPYLQPGRAYHAYYFADVLLSFEVA